MSDHFNTPSHFLNEGKSKILQQHEHSDPLLVSCWDRDRDRGHCSEGEDRLKGTGENLIQTARDTSD